jgi:ribosomal protein L16 Arg81 hydroxylase
MTDPLTTFRKLLSPISPLAFLEDNYGKVPLHVPGRASKVRQVCSWADFANLMDMTALWSGDTLKVVLDGKTLPPDEYCSQTTGRDGPAVLRPDYAKVQASLEQGATIVADLVETLSPGIRAAATALEMGVGAHVTCNAYMSQQARQAFPSHFDTMEVFALQVEGRKVWRVYEGRFDGPLERPGYSYPYFSQDHHERAKGDLAFEVELQPGDLLYIPAGQYHDALASTDACLHLSFGVTRPTVLDYFSWLTGSLDDLADFRAVLPDYRDTAGRDNMLAAAESHLAKLLSAGAARAQFGGEMQRQAHRLQSPVEMPPGRGSPRYRVAPAELGKRGNETALHMFDGEFELDGATAQLARWLMERDLTAEDEMLHRLRKLDADTARSAMAFLIEAGLLVRLHN